MTQQQKRGAAALSFAIVGFMAAYLCWLVATIILTDGSLGDRAPGRQFVLSIYNWDTLATALKTVPVVLTIGISILARYPLKDWQFYATVAASLLGLAAATFLLLDLSSIDTARRFWAYSPVPNLEEYATFVAAAQKGLVPLIIWLASVFAIQLGIKL